MRGYDLFVGKVSLIYPHANYEWRSDVGTLRQFHYLENGILAFPMPTPRTSTGCRGRTPSPTTVRVRS